MEGRQTGAAEGDPEKRRGRKGGATGKLEAGIEGDAERDDDGGGKEPGNETVTAAVGRTGHLELTAPRTLDDGHWDCEEVEQRSEVCDSASWYLERDRSSLVCWSGRRAPSVNRFIGGPTAHPSSFPSIEASCGNNGSLALCVCIYGWMYAEKISMTLEEHQQRARFALITRRLCTCIHSYILFSFRPTHSPALAHSLALL